MVKHYSHVVVELLEEQYLKEEQLLGQRNGSPGWHFWLFFSAKLRRW